MAHNRGYLGTYTNKKSKGIYSFSFDSGKFTDIKLEAELGNPTYINRRGKEVFVVTKGNGEGGISYFIEDDDKLHFVNKVMNSNISPCYIISNDKYIFTANYHEGKCHVYAVIDGILQEVHNIMEDPSSKCHCITLDKENKYIYVCFLGLDEIKIYDIEDGFKYTSSLKFPKVSGPRHSVFSSDNRYLYVLSELSNEVFLFEKQNGNYILKQSISTLPKDFTGKSSSAAIRLSSDEKFLYTSNRGHDSIAAFKVSEGLLEIIDYYKTEGKNPRDFNFDPEEEYLLVVNQDSDNGISFIRNKDTGTLEKIVDNVYIDSSVCIVFIK